MVAVRAKSTDIAQSEIDGEHECDVKALTDTLKDKAMKALDQAEQHQNVRQ